MQKIIAKFTVILLLFLVPPSLSGETLSNKTQEGELKVILRLIGHRILLSQGDSTSLVLPITKENNRYKIQFQSPIAFIPQEVKTIIKEIIKKTNLPPNYLVEIEDCYENEVIYSYEIFEIPNPTLTPCLKRGQDKNCYIIFISFVDNHGSLFTNPQTTTIDNLFVKNSFFSRASSLTIFLLLIGLISLYYFRSNKPKIYKTKEEYIVLGKFVFDKKNMLLKLGNKNIELTNKESDLLFLLYHSLEKTIKREDILKEVWEDEGDYIGRTLDVFISKLRKKLALDNSIKIINTRGVGYKLLIKNE